MLARKDLNWSATNPRLYNEAFTGRARTIPRCSHCLADDHHGAACPHNLKPPILGWLQSPSTLHWIQQFQQPVPPKIPKEVCCNYNANRCRFPRCRYIHACTNCGGPHPALSCSVRRFPDRGPPPQSRPPPRPRQGQPAYRSLQGTSSLNQ